MFETFVNVELLRSHKGIKWPGGFEQHPFIDLSLLPDNQYRLALLMLHLHGRTTNKKKKYEMNGIYQSLYPNADPDKLIKDGLLGCSTDRETMTENTINELYDIAVELGLNIKKRLKRQEILDAMLPYASSPIIKDRINEKRIYQLTDKGYVIARSLYAEREALEKNIYSLLKGNHPQKAIGLWEAYKSRQYGQHVSMGKNLFSMHITDNDQRAILACNELYGASPMFYPTEKATPQAVYEKMILRTQETLINYANAEYDKYEILAICDCITCKTCANMDGKVFKLENADIGATCPPFHDGCRCQIAPVINGLKRKPIGRFARNPLTDKSETTYAKTYKLWQKSLSQEALDALISKRGWK